MATELAMLFPNSAELAHIRRHLHPRKRTYRAPPARKEPGPFDEVEIDEWELDLVEIFALGNLQGHPDTD